MPIEVSENTRIFAQGVAAGNAADEQLAELAGENPTHEQRVGYFWLIVGTQLGVLLPDATKEQRALFVHGAATRAPADEPALVVRVESIAGAAFHLPGYDPDDESTHTAEDLRRTQTELHRLLLQAGRALDSESDEGTLYDRNHKAVGSYRINLWG